MVQKLSEAASTLLLEVSQDPGRRCLRRDEWPRVAGDHLLTRDTFSTT